MFASNGLKFTSSNVLQFSAAIIAGGASGGGTFTDNYASGGGGAGGVLITNINFILNSTINVIVGAGGPAPGRFYRGINGTASTIQAIDIYTAIGGGGGGGNGVNDPSTSAQAGGSGGGQSLNSGATTRPNTPGGAGTPGQGNAGGAVDNFASSAGGGGGYSAPGGNADGIFPGTKGAGYLATSSYTGKNYSYGGNGGGLINPQAGGANTGNGGDGVRSSLVDTGFAGGSGAVLIYVPNGRSFNLFSGTVNTYTLTGFASVKEFITSGSFSLS